MKSRNQKQKSPIIYKELEFLPPDSLAAFARNSRTHSAEQVAQIVASINEFGFTNPILIAEENSIIAGHGRVQAALAMGLKEVPCLRITGLSEDQRRAYVIADNKLAENAGWDNELLALELGELRDNGFEMDLIGFSRNEMEDIFLGEDGLEEEGNTDPDEIPETKASYTSKLGDVWVCGEHRVMCGDSTVITDMEALTSGSDVDMCWTDPPYNVNYEGTAGKIENDNMGADAFQQFLTDAFIATFSVMKAGASLYVAHADTEGLPFRTAFAGAGFKLSGCLVWVKPSLVLGRSDYQWRHEPILYGWKPGAAHRWFGGRKLTTVVDAVDAPFTVSADGSVQIDAGSTTLRISGSDLKVEELVSSVVRHEKPSRNTEHPTMKPVGLIVGYLNNSSRRGDLVLDPFGGSGSTLIACQKLGRKAMLMELDPRFADVIVRRWQNFTGQKALLQANGKLFDDLELKQAP